MKVNVSPPPWEGKEAVTATWAEGGYRRFALRGRTDIISVNLLTVGEMTEMLIYPERSSTHKALVVALELNEA